MRYLCLVYFEPHTFERMSEEEKKTLDRDSLAYDRDLARSGHFIHAHALQSVEQAMTVRVRDSKMSSTDGPFAETKEHLSGFIIIEARDLNEAIRLAGTIPMVRFGTIEVRPVRELERYTGEGAR
jgi:hypothetical protein